MDRLFNSVIVRAPASNYPSCVSTNPERDTIDLDLARKQHEEYVKILRENGIEVIELPSLEGYPDSVFVQDTSIIGAGSKKAVICRFGEPSRRGEERSIKAFLEERGFTTVEIHEPGTLEGGDVMVTDAGIVFIGESSRTNREGIRQFAAAFPHVKTVGIKLTKIFHLLSGVNYLGKKRVAISPQVIDAAYFQGFKLIKIPPDELYANNLLYLGEERVLIPAGYPKTRDKLRKEGFRVIEVDVSEFWKGDGGVTCLNSPFYLPL